MSKHNYSQYSNKKSNDKPKEEEIVVTAEIDTPVQTEAPVTEAPVTEAPAEVKMEAPHPKPKTAIGVVANCSKLNVRTEASIDSDAAAVLSVNSEVKIDLTKSNKDWFKICTATGIDGYCMRKFVNMQP